MALRTKLIVLIAVLVCTCFRLSAWAPPAFYKYQIGISAGLGSNTAPKMKLGSHLAVNARVMHHAFGLRIENFGDIAIFQKASYMNFRGLYYGWAWAGEFAQCQVTGGGGFIDYQYNHGTWLQVGTGLYGDVSITGLVNYRGNGLGVKLAGNINPLEGFISAAIFLQLGWAWKPENEDVEVSRNVESGL